MINFLKLASCDLASNRGIKQTEKYVFRFHFFIRDDMWCHCFFLLLLVEPNI